MLKESKDVDKRCTFSSLVCNYDNLCAINYKNKTAYTITTPHLTAQQPKAIWNTVLHEQHVYINTETDTLNLHYKPCTVL